MGERMGKREGLVKSNWRCSSLLRGCLSRVGVEYARPVGASQTRKNQSGMEASLSRLPRGLLSA